MTSNPFLFQLQQTVYYVEMQGYGRTAEEARTWVVKSGKVFARRANKTKPPTYYLKDGHCRHAGHPETLLYADEQIAQATADKLNSLRSE